MLRTDGASTRLRVISRELVTVAFFLLLAGSFGCAPSPQGGGQDSPASASQPLPELTKEIIDERINDARVYDVAHESGTGDPIPWGFDGDEPKEITIIERHVDGTRATIVLDIKTRSAPRSRIQRHLAGQIRTMWQLETGWVLRKWVIVNTENISMKYRDLSQPNANRQ